jgi:hypothetical protein
LYVMNRPGGEGGNAGETNGRAKYEIGNDQRG